MLPALKKNKDASLKKEAKFEFGAYAKAAGASCVFCVSCFGLGWGGWVGLWVVHCVLTGVGWRMGHTSTDPFTFNPPHHEPTKCAGKPLEETGVSLDNLKCMFKYVQDNRVDFEDKLWDLKRCVARAFVEWIHVLDLRPCRYQPHASHRRLTLHTYPFPFLSLPPF